MNRSNWLAGALAILLAASPVILTTSADAAIRLAAATAVAATTEAATTAVFVGPFKSRSDSAVPTASARNRLRTV